MSLVRSLATAAAALTFAVSAHAQTFSTGVGAGTTTRGPGNSPAQGVTLASNMKITSFAFWIGTATNQNMKFYIVDRSTGTTVFSQERMVTARASGTYTSTNAFELLLNSGTVYDFGVVGTATNTVRFINPAITLSSNGISLAGTNVNYDGFTTLTRDTDNNGRATIALEINGAATNVVPEPSTYALMGTGLIGLVGVMRRRRVA